jgi:hypothetical protein
VRKMANDIDLWTDIEELEKRGEYIYELVKQFHKKYIEVE